MPTQVSNQSLEFSQVVKDASAAATVVAQSIDEENKVFLSFCEGLINNTLQAMTTLSKLDVNIARAGMVKQLASAQKQSNKQADEKKQAITEAADKASPNQASPSVAENHENLSMAFLDSMNTLMMNAVSGQQNLHVLALAATTQTISTILSLTTATIGVAVEHITTK